MTTFVGTVGNDVFHGGSGVDTFVLTQGGDDTATGGDGGDVFFLGEALTAADRIDGEGGPAQDVLSLDGDYSAGLTFLSSTMQNIEKIDLHAGNSYRLTLVDGNIAAGQTLHVDGSLLGSGDSLWINEKHETDGAVDIIGGSGADTMYGGSAAALFEIQHGGTDKVFGGAGGDQIIAEAAFDKTDRIDGGGGSDVLILDGDYSAGVKFGPATLTNVEEIDLAAGSSYKLTINDATVATGGVLTLDATNLGGAGDAVNFNGSAETDGVLHLHGGAGADKLVGGAGDDSFYGAGGQDLLTGGGGADSFIFQSINDSTTHAPVRITDLSDLDNIDLGAIDADATVGGDQAFTLVSSFTHTPGEAKLAYSSASGKTTLSLDTDGDGVANSKILIDGDHSGFTDFVL